MPRHHPTLNFRATPRLTHILDRYEVRTEDLLGQGAFSAVHKGFDCLLGKEVAVKSYLKTSSTQKKSLDDAQVLARFTKQIGILEELKGELVITRAEAEAYVARRQRLKDAVFGNVVDVKPFHAIRLNFDDAFVQLLDFSKDAAGAPAAHPKDRLCYTVLELATLSLQNYLDAHRRDGTALSVKNVRDISWSVLSALACLHVKNLVHLDLKPDNIMYTPSGKWKLIDVDGAVEAASVVPKKGNTLVFTPLFCAPEFARQLVDEESKVLVVSRAYDLWSAGLLFAQLVLQIPVFKTRMKAYITRDGHLGGFFENVTLGIEVPPRLDRLFHLHPDFYDLTVNHLIVADEARRATVLEALAHSFFAPPSTSHSSDDGHLKKSSRELVDASCSYDVFVISADSGSSEVSEKAADVAASRNHKSFSPRKHLNLTPTKQLLCPAPPSGGLRRAPASALSLSGEESYAMEAEPRDIAEASVETLVVRVGERHGLDMWELLTLADGLVSAGFTSLADLRDLQEADLVRFALKYKCPRTLLEAIRQSASSYQKELRTFPTPQGNSISLPDTLVRLTSSQPTEIKRSERKSPDGLLPLHLVALDLVPAPLNHSRSIIGLESRSQWSPIVGGMKWKNKKAWYLSQQDGVLSERNPNFSSGVLPGVPHRTDHLSPHESSLPLPPHRIPLATLGPPSKQLSRHLTVCAVADQKLHVAASGATITRPFSRIFPRTTGHKSHRDRRGSRTRGCVIQ